MHVLVTITKKSNFKHKSTLKRVQKLFHTRFYSKIDSGYSISRLFDSSLSSVVRLKLVLLMKMIFTWNVTKLGMYVGHVPY